MKGNILKSKLAGNIYFVVVFILLFFYYGLNETLFYPPQSVHIWRQTNSLSLAQNYYQNNYPLLKSEMHNQFPDDGHSGKSVGEFPIIYYVVAQLWKLFGKHEWIFKFLQVSLLFLGLFSLFHVGRRLLGNTFWAGFISLLIFTSPMVIYYGPNFLPDVPALSFVFISWFFISKFFDTKRLIYLWGAALFFCLSMLLKITCGTFFVALGGWVAYEIIFQDEDKRIFNFRFRHILPFLVAIIPVVAWYWYAGYYNHIHKGHFSVHGIWPIWGASKEQLNRIIDSLDQIYFKEFFLPFTQYLTLGIWIYLVIRIKKLKPVFRFFILVLAVGFLLQVLLWFQVLDAHDYYMINLLVVFVSVWGVFLYQIRQGKPVVQYIAYGLAIIFFTYNVITCKHRAEGRYIGWMNSPYENNYKALRSMEPLFDELGVGMDDKVISIPDPSINGTLYYMNRKGYTDFGSDFSNADGFYKRIEDGAKYLIVNDTSVLSKEYLAPFIQNEIGRYGNIRIFNIYNSEK